MKKYLLPKDGTFYKANLHCHTLISDGHWTPEQVKDAYKKAGYSIVAFTDHDIMIPHHELDDEDFLAMTGYEMEVDAPFEEWGEQKTCHMCFVALTPDVTEQVCWNRARYGYTWGNALELVKKGYARFDESKPDFVRTYTPDCINKMMKTGREAGFFVTYNHPTWSMEDYSNYIHYEGMHAMEIVNNGSFMAGFEEYNGRVFDEMIRAGKRVYCTATDDNHNFHADNRDCFGGFVMIKADKLEYETIGKALLAGDFYASQAPLIEELYIEDGKVHVKTSPARRIAYLTGRIHSEQAYAQEGETVSEATFTVRPNHKYFRIDVIDEKGRIASSQAYYVDELKDYLG